MKNTDVEGKTLSKAETKAETAIKRQGRERRKHDRAQCDGFAEVILEHAAFLFRGNIRDLSLSGCYIQSNARLALARGTSVGLRLAVQGEELQLPAQIMIVRPGAGAGFEFLEMEPEIQSRLSSLLHKLVQPVVSQGAAIAEGASANSEAAISSRELWR